MGPRPREDMAMQSGDVASFRYHLVAQRAAAATIRNYIAGASLWLAWCNAEGLDYLKASRNDMTRWLGELSESQAQSTVRLRLLCLRVFYDFLVETSGLEANPARQIKLTPQVSRPVEILTDKELQAMIEVATRAEDKAIIFLLLGGGLRRAESFNIRREDVNFEDGTIRVLGKGNKWRTIAPGKAAMQAVRIAMWNKDRLFDRTNDDYVWRRVQRLAQLAGVKGRVFPHRFRYTFAVDFSEAGGSVEYLQTILGHSTLDMALRYSRQGREQRALRAQQEYNPADRLTG